MAAFFWDTTMKRAYKKSKTCTAPIAHLHEHVAYHEAGHVTAIYLRNQQQKLPPVFFQITFNSMFQFLSLGEIEKNR